MVVEQDNIVLYPNPAKDILFIDMTSSVREEITIRLFDLSGRLVSENTVLAVEGNNTFRVALSALEAGMYHVQVFKGAQKPSQEK
ncbi:MAG: T9SS type A sorting domain-containing protein [Bacteroidota bacterium]|nr:MAG: T9SS type A sorting domain-containing protein [Bacteroidota bacterium]